MLRYTLMSAVRSLRRNPGYAMLNTLGLTIGLAVGFILLLWVRDELSYDRFYENSDRIYRVMRTATFGGDMSTSNAVTAELDNVLDEEYPEIELVSIVGWPSENAIVRGDIAFREHGRHVGQDFFRIFRHPFLAGDPAEAMRAPDSIVLTESLARKYFPEVYEASSGRGAAQQVLGQTLSFENRMDLQVTGVIEDVPDNTSVDFDFVVAFEEYAARNDWVWGWGNNGFRMYALLAPGSDHALVSEKIRTVIQDNNEESTAVLFLQPLTDIYLKSEFEDGVQTGGRIEYVRIFSIVGLMILLIACINYTNLATARSSRRALEIGVRKTFGARRSGLSRMLIGESVLTAVPAMIAAVAIVWLALPAFNQLTRKSIQIEWGDPLTVSLFVGITAFVGILAGVYPALYISGLNIIRIFRGSERSSGASALLRRGLVVTQFTASAVLIVATLTVYRQLSYIQSANIGIDRENVFRAELQGPINDRYASFKEELLREPAILSVTSGWFDPFSVSSSTTGAEFDGKDPDDNTLYYMLTAGHDYVETHGMELVAGRNFSMTRPADTANVIVNETAARTMGFDDPIGQRFAVWGREGEIIGVVRDFHHRSMYEPIEPTIIRLSEAQEGLIFVRAAAGRTADAVEHFEAVYADFNRGFPLEISFLDDEYNNMYRSEQVIQTLAQLFAVIALVLAGLGLLGLASFTAERRRREIGIRKVLGASSTGIVGLLTREYVLLVVISLAVAAPVALIVMDGWLSQFEYRVDLGWELFALAGLVMIAATYLTVGYQSVRAALANPVEALRTE